MFNTYMVANMAEPVKPPVFFGRYWSLRYHNKINRCPTFQNLMPGRLKRELQSIFRVGSDPGFSELHGDCGGGNQKNCARKEVNKMGFLNREWPHKLQSQRVMEAIWFSSVRFAAFSITPFSRSPQISEAIFASIAAPMKNV